MRPQIAVVALLSAVTNGASLNRRATTVLPTNSFSSFDNHWNWFYPGGVTDHNGGARMDKEHVKFEGGNTVVITAEPVTGEPPSKHGGRTIPINYRAGAIHSKETFTVEKGGGYDFNAEFLVNPISGTWPAFWVSGAESWPPEIDMAEWMGDGNILFNTWNTSDSNTSKSLPYKNPEKWQSVKTQVRDENGKDVRVTFTFNGEVVATQFGAGFVGKPLNL